MTKITVKYRHKKYALDVDASKTIIELKKAASELTGIKPDKFNFEVKSHEVLDHKKIESYIDKGETTFEMTDVRIEVTVVLNDRRYSCNVGESRMIGSFADDLVKLSGHNTHLSICYNGEILDDRNTILSSGVENKDTLTAVNKSPFAEKKKVTVQYRKKFYPFEVKKKELVLNLRKRVSELTGILVENFCLKIENFYLLDTKAISVYGGNDYIMDNVTINVIIVCNGIEYPIFIQELSTILELMEKIITQVSSVKDIYIFYNNKVLEKTETVLSCDIENNSVVFAVDNKLIISPKVTLTIAYRDESYSVAIDSSSTVNDIKSRVSELSKINVNNFSLQMYWIPLDDSKSISEYLKYGANLRMTNVTIKVTVRLNDKNYHFSVKEEITVADLKILILQKATEVKTIKMYYNNQVLVDESTLLESNIEHNSAILVLSTLHGG